MKNLFAFALVTLAASASFAHDAHFQGEFVNNGPTSAPYYDAVSCAEAGGSWTLDYDSYSCGFSRSSRLTIAKTGDAFNVEVYSRVAKLDNGDMCYMTGQAERVSENQLVLTSKSTRYVYDKKTGTAAPIHGTCKTIATFSNDYTVEVKFEGECAKTCTDVGLFWATRKLNQ